MAPKKNKKPKPTAAVLHERKCNFFVPQHQASRAWTTNAQSASAPSASDIQPSSGFLKDFSNVSQEQSFLSEHNCNHRRSQLTNGAKSEHADSRKRKADKEDARKNPPAVQDEEKDTNGAKTADEVYDGTLEDVSEAIEEDPSTSVDAHNSATRNVERFNKTLREQKFGEENGFPEEYEAVCAQGRADQKKLKKKLKKKKKDEEEKKEELNQSDEEVVEQVGFNNGKEEDTDDEEKEEEDIEALEVKSACVLLQERLDREEESGKVIDLMNSPEDLDRKRKANEEEDVKAADNKKAKGPWTNKKKQKTKREKTKLYYLKTYPRMIFVTNKENPNNPPELANLPDSEFPLQLSDERVIDIFVDYAMSKDICDLCGIKTSDDEQLDMDHTHDRASEIAKKESGLFQRKASSSSGVFRMFLHPTCNKAMGLLDARIEQNSQPTPTADEKNVTAVTYDPKTVLNKQLIKKLLETFSLTATLQKTWSTSDLARSIEDEESMIIERKGFKAEYGTEAYKAWHKKKKPIPAWTEAQEDKLEEGLKRYGWGDWVMIAGKYVHRFSEQCNAKARSKNKFHKYKNRDAFPRTSRRSECGGGRIPKDEQKK